jgi:hypothetical protein
MTRKCSLLLALLLLVIVPVPGTTSADEVFNATTAITLPAGQKVRSFDISFVDPVIGLYLLADRTNKAVNVIDTGTNTVLFQLGKGQFAGTQSCNAKGAGPNDCAGPNGVITVGHREAWVGDGPRVDAAGNVTVGSTIKVFDLRSQQLTHTIPTGGQRRADELCLDPRHHLVLMANDAETTPAPALAPVPFITFIPTSGPDAYTVVKTITFPEATNGIEQCQWSPRTGKFYLNIPEVNGPGDDTADGNVYVIDPETMEVVDKFDIPIADCAGPQGMAIGPENQILLGCNAPSIPSGIRNSVIINEHSGAIVARLENEGGADEVWFNEGDDHYFLARSAATPHQQLGVVDARGHHEDPSVDTANPGPPNAHSVAADPILNQVYVPIPGAISSVCSSAGGSDAQGCIAVFTATSAP